MFVIRFGAGFEIVFTAFPPVITTPNEAIGRTKALIHLYPSSSLLGAAPQSVSSHSMDRVFTSVMAMEIDCS